MPFLGCFLYPNLEKPAKIYMHSAGYAEAFGTKQGVPDLEAGGSHVADIIRRNRNTVSPADFLIAPLWGDRETKVAELFGYGDLKEWRSNPTIYSWVFRNSVHQPGERQISCGETLVVLGEEENYRRSTINLHEYSIRIPFLPMPIVTPEFKSLTIP